MDNLVSGAVITAQVSLVSLKRALTDTSSLPQSPLTTVVTQQPVAAGTGPGRAKSR